MATLRQDVRYALRMLRRSPGFTAVAVLSLSLGIGANTAIFGLIDTLMLRSLPVRDPGRLVELLRKYPRPDEPRFNGFSWASYEHFRDRNHVFSDLIGMSQARWTVRAEGIEPETLNGQYVVGQFFQALGVRPAIGRLVAPEDDYTGASAAAVAVVSWSYWKNRFNLDPAILGKRITVDGMPATIVGVAPRGFYGLDLASQPDIWMPCLASGRMQLALVGRLKPGVSIGQARAEMAVLFRFVLEEESKTSKDPLMQRLKLELEPAGAGLSRLRDLYAKPLLLLMAVVGLLLLIACTNLASMLLARAAARQREMAIRVSLGAGRLRLVRQALTESVLLSVAGTLPGVAIALFGAHALVTLMTSGRPVPGMPPHLDIPVHLDGHVLVFAAGVALLTGVLFGLAPAWTAFTSAPASSLRASGRAGETRLGRLFGKGLVAAQVALSVVLLNAAALFIGNLSNLQHLDVGFRRDHVLLVSLDPARSGYTREQLSLRYQELLGRLQAIPGVRSATMNGAIPMSGMGASRFATVEGHPERPEDRRYLTLNWVAPRYFETYGTPLLAGRDFTFQDRGPARVAIVNQAMARFYFGGASPIGKHFTFLGEETAYEIVGLVGDAKYYEIREAPPRTIYLSAFQLARPPNTFALRTSVPPASVSGDARRVVRDWLPGVTVARITTLDDVLDASIVTERLIATLSGLFGALGASLAAIGLYGLLAYTVARRVNEIGIRMALGATRGNVTRMVLGDASGMVVAGLALGIPLALWSRRVAASLVQGLPLASAVPMVFGAGAMIAIALLAAYVPARRAAGVDPTTALRYE
jgi:predicted permease